MNAQLISIGTELTMGQTIDTNAAWLAQQLAAVGIECDRHVTVPDDLAPITRAIREAAGEADLLLITGGLGPTVDDLTRQALADAAGVPLEFRPECLAAIEAFFAHRNRPMHPQNRVQAMIPAGFSPIDNTCGTAPGMTGRLKKSIVFVMPGVPREMKTMFARDVLPAIHAASPSPSQGEGRSEGPTPARHATVILQRVIRTFGMPEAEVGEKIADLMARGRNPTVGTSAADLIISIRINARAESELAARALIDHDADEIHRRLGIAVFGEGDDTISDAAARLLIAQKKTIATAESCTGGLIAKRLTDVPGSSAYFIQSFVTYSNDAKQRLLEIPAELLAAHGAVSPEIAQAMAANCRRLAGTDFALSATGIAGPTGGTTDKPVGLVYIALAQSGSSTSHANATNSELPMSRGTSSSRGLQPARPIQHERTPDSDCSVCVKELRFGESLTRDEIRDRTAKAAINLLRLALLQAP
ncbi:MAG: putative competence-damage inducible protein [Phycisphaerae bacterium]|nr:MAG: competence/damage-inducible protein A [Planctomycetia bacterium]RIK69936.1 MAG: competence/damage-inducible protein A [Planctomycetota bacterium]GJQ27055.1 MAG: putative competence-damage inducible protein [Phycisphaerae bacterium]